MGTTTTIDRLSNRTALRAVILAAIGAAIAAGAWAFAGGAVASGSAGTSGSIHSVHVLADDGVINSKD